MLFYVGLTKAQSEEKAKLSPWQKALKKEDAHQSIFVCKSEAHGSS